MTKCYVPDTSVLLQSPQALFGFADNDVILPKVVLEELDSKKTSSKHQLTQRHKPSHT